MRFSMFCSQETQELIDAELSARVLQLISMTDTGAHAQVRWNWFINLTWIIFLEQHLNMNNELVYSQDE